LEVDSVAVDSSEGDVLLELELEVAASGTGAAGSVARERRWAPAEPVETP
jgi:hypothetical protein